MEPRKMVDITRDKPIKVTIRVVVPVRDHPKFNFVGKLLGPKGNSLKRLQEETMTKMAILGRGSMRDRHKEDELRKSGDPKFAHLTEDLHVEITSYAPPAEAHARIAYALAEVRRFLVPDYNDEIRQEQMWEMHVINSGKSATSGDSDDAEDADSSRASTCPSTTDHHITTPTGVGSSCRKRPLAAHGTGTRAAIAMSPTKRTVLSILARARAAQAKHISRPLSNGRQLAVRIKTSGLIAPGPDLVIN
ncbi:KH domain-containing, RNA-binding, signal transduction-associated protein 2 isoform X2 [Nilaparvata lugens]|nr:KH domain-containing, RNA-binding, signal transduction-associated protein 2 isoform X2 [Nilaparvata lugens]